MEQMSNFVARKRAQGWKGLGIDLSQRHMVPKHPRWKAQVTKRLKSHLVGLAYHYALLASPD